MTVTEAELPQKFDNLWKKAKLAFEQKNWEYVVSLALPIIKEVPCFLDGRKTLRTAEASLTGGKKSFSLGGGSLFGGSKKDPWEAIADLEETVFQKDPFSASGNQKLYELAMKVGYPDLAAFALDTIRMGHPENTKNMHALAQHYLAHNQPDKAGEIYTAIRKVDPRDMIAIKGEKDSAAMNSINRGGWDNNKPGGGKKDSEEARMLELLAKKGRTPEQTQEILNYFAGLYQRDPDNINTLKSLGQIYDEMGDTTQALEYYDYALSKNPGDVALERLTDMVRDKAQVKYIQDMEVYLAANEGMEGIEEAKAQLAEVKRQRNETMLKDARARVERNPTDKTLRFELGQAYFLASMFTEAIPELQQAKGNPHIRTKAMLLLGRCFERKNMNDLAKGALSDAAKELSVMDATKKEVLYELALVHEKMGEREPYLDALKEIYNSDYGYRDVATRVESSYQ